MNSESNSNIPNTINKPSHYIGINGLEVETVLQNFIPKYKDGYVAHRASSAIEYLLRSPEKNGLEDIKKAKQNLEQIIEYEEGKSKPLEFDGNEPEEVRNNDGLVIFMEALSNIKSLNPDINNDIITYRAGTNPLD